MADVVSDWHTNLFGRKTPRPPNRLILVVKSPRKKSFDGFLAVFFGLLFYKLLFSVFFRFFKTREKNGFVTAEKSDKDTKFCC